MSNREGAGAVLQASGLEKRYDDGERVIEVLRGLDLALMATQGVAIVGPSGVGKSTLLHLLGMLDRPDAGAVFVEGQDASALRPSEQAALRNRAIGFVFQFHYLLGDFDALDNVMMPLLIGGLARSPARKRAAAVLERVGLGDRTTHRPGELSGGEQQRVAVARALVTEPKVVLADEPSGNLDPDSAAQIHQLLRAVQREQGCALAVATHNASLASMMDKVYRVHDGVLVETRGL